MNNRIKYYITGALFLISATLYLIADIGVIFAACLGVAGLCFIFTGLNSKK